MRIGTWALLTAIVTLSTLAGPAAAHVELFASEPAAGGTTTEGARHISLTFISLDTEEPVRVGVVDDDDVDHVAGQPRIRPPDRGTEVVVPVRPLSLGEYTVTWTATADDGDGRASGSFTFTVVESTQSDVTWVWWLGAPAAIGGVTALLVRSSRRSP